MTWKAEQLALEGLMNSQWTDSTVPVIYDNSPISPPTSGSWLRFRIYGVGSTVAGVGGSTTMHRGSKFIEIVANVEKGTGTATARELCDTAAAIFRDYTGLPHYVFKSPWPQRLGEDKGWWREAVTIPFEHDEFF